MKRLKALGNNANHACLQLLQANAIAALICWYLSHVLMLSTHGKDSFGGEEGI